MKLTLQHRILKNRYFFKFNIFQLQKAKPFIDKKEPIMAYKRGFEEETFLKAMDIPPSNFQFLCDHCTKVS